MLPSCKKKRNRKKLPGQRRRRATCKKRSAKRPPHRCPRRRPLLRAIKRKPAKKKAALTATSCETSSAELQEKILQESVSPSGKSEESAAKLQEEALQEPVSPLRTREVSAAAARRHEKCPQKPSDRASSSRTRRAAAAAKEARKLGGTVPLPQIEDEDIAETVDDPEEKAHRTYWEKVLRCRKGFTLCLICHLEGDETFLERKTHKIVKHCKSSHRKEGFICDKDGCVARAKTKHDIGVHQYTCHGI
ncbi:hypothetical protein ACP4OV_001933 [Aristida adscensionis]